MSIPHSSKTHPIVVSPPMIPSQPTATFLDSSFFRRHPSGLPTPARVREIAMAPPQVFVAPYGTQLVRFPELNLLVKFGKGCTLEEGQTLLAVDRILHDAVPVPEVYGWAHDGEYFFLYMELLPGVTLKEKWETISETEKDLICEQLSAILRAMKRLKQDDGELFLGTITRKPLQDVIFSHQIDPAGPFASVAAFHDFFALTAIPPDRRRPGLILDERADMPDDAGICFTHADLHRNNIIVTDSSPTKVVGILDWAQAGWYPVYWEYCKAAWSSHWEEDWRKVYLPRMLACPDAVYQAFDYITLCTGAF